MISFRTVFGAQPISLAILLGFLVMYAVFRLLINMENDERLKLLNCKDMEELQEYSGLSFHNLIAPEDHDRVMDSIWYHEGDSNKKTRVF